jgi:predicted nucleotide-binding protein
MVTATHYGHGPTASSNRKVFVVHGRDAKARISMFQFLRSIDLEPIEWSKAVQMTGKASPYVGEVLDAAFGAACAVVALFTPDDEGKLRADFINPNDPIHERNLTHQARQNVLFEAGMAMGRFPDRTIIVELGNLRPFSDIVGRHTIRLNNTTELRQDLAQRLKSAGCAVNLTGTDWHTAGDFSIHQPSIPPATPIDNGVSAANGGGSGLPPGGTQGQVLQKLTDTSVGWDFVRAGPPTS